MNRTKRMFRGLTLATVGLVSTALAADAPTRTIDAGSLTFQVPAAWKSVKPSSAMRRAQLSIEPVKGDEEPAEAILVVLPGGGGSVEANVKRWQGFFVTDEGVPPKVDSRVVKGKNVDVTRVEAAGRYVAPVMPGSTERYDKPNYRLLGAITNAGETGVYLRLIGPEKTVAAARSAFDEVIASMTVEK